MDPPHGSGVEADAPADSEADKLEASADAGNRATTREKIGLMEEYMALLRKNKLADLEMKETAEAMKMLESHCPSLSSMKGAFNRLISVELVKEEGSEHLTENLGGKLKARNKKKRKRGDAAEGEEAPLAAENEAQQITSTSGGDPNMPT